MSESIQREDNDTDPHLIILNWLTIASDEDERQEASQDSHSMYVIHVFGKGASLSLFQVYTKYQSTGEGVSLSQN